MARISDRFPATLAGLSMSMLIASASIAVAEPCGTVVAAGTSLTLTSNIGPCDDDEAAVAITVEDGATLDLNGKYVLCEDYDFDLDRSDGILILGTQSHVSNGIVNGCAEGVMLRGEGKHLVESVRVEDGHGDGFVVEAGSSKNKILACSSLGREGAGFRVEADHTKMQDCSSGGHAYGFWLSGSRNRASDCTATGSFVGFEIDGEKNRISDSAASSSYYGIEAAGEGTSIRNTTITQNSSDGLRVSRSATVMRNTLSGNDQGIHVLSTAREAKLVRNSSSLHATLDMVDDVAGCASHLWRDNTFGTANDDCIH